VNATAPTPFPSTISTQISNESPPVYRSYYWIRIDPIGDRQPGDHVTITSTTNLSAGDEILVQAYSSHSPHQKIPTGESSGASGTVKVQPGNGGINTISFVVNTSTFDPDEYIVTEDAVLREATATAIFNLIPDPLLHGNASLKSGNFINWENLGLPPLRINTSIKPEISPGELYLNQTVTQKGQISYGSVIIFAPDNIVRCFDRNGTQYATYFGFHGLRFVYPPSASAVYNGPVENVTTITDNGERILTEIYEVPANY
jgi:hypothetical protein